MTIRDQLKGEEMCPQKRFCQHCGVHTEDLVCDENGMVKYDWDGAVGRGAEYRCPLRWSALNALEGK